MIHFSYPVTLKRQKEGGYLVKFPSLPEAITQGETINEALSEAADCLEEAIANRLEMKMDIPLPHKTKKRQYTVSLHATLATKLALYLTMRENRLNNAKLAKKLDWDEKEIRRLLDPHYPSKLPRIEYALYQLGQRLEIGISHL